MTTQATVHYSDLRDRVAIVTGGAHGMGRGHCLALAAQGMRVAIADIDVAAAEAVAEVIVARGDIAVAHHTDVSARDSVEAMVAAVMKRWGQLDAIVSNAGIVNSGTRLGDTDDEWRRQFAIHVDGAFYLSRAAVPHLRRSSAGRIVIISSEWGQVPPGYAYGYCAAKGVLIALGKNLAYELAEDGILVNVVAPGTIRTRMLDEPQNAGWSTSSLEIPVGRAADPAEVAAAVAFLVSDQSSFVTGQVLPVNGGSTVVGI